MNNLVEPTNLEKLQEIIEDVEKYFKEEKLRIEATEIVIKEIMEDDGISDIFETYLSQVHNDVIDVSTMLDPSKYDEVVSESQFENI